MTSIYADLKKRAKAKGLTLKKIAKEAGVPLRTLSEWRNTLPLTLQHYENLCRVLAEDDRDRDQPAPDTRHTDKPQ